MKKRATTLLTIILLAVWSGFSTMAQTHKADDIIGTWLNQEATGKIELFKEKDKYFGKVVWLKEPNDKVTGKPRTDIENPEAKLKSDPLVGMVNMKNFTFDGKEEWSGGTIYDPKNGKTYKCYIRFEAPNKLKVRGFIGVSILGRNTFWTKTTPPQK
ncbi:MAG: DUF2147 domain-containing protein [Bacteroidetes bacterium]|nr:DUF2147 domain-containing protein [Bacteroidota bacterium]